MSDNGRYYKNTPRFTDFISVTNRFFMFKSHLIGISPGINAETMQNSNDFNKNSGYIL